MFANLRDYFVGEIISRKNFLDAAKVRIIFDLVFFAIVLTLVIGLYTQYLGHVSISLRAYISVIIMLSLLFVTKATGGINIISHVLIILTAVSVLSNAFLIIQDVDYSTIALFIANTIFCFYLVSLRAAIIYSIIQAFGLISVMLLKAQSISWTDLPSALITDSEQALSFFVVLLLIFYLLIQFQRANQAFSIHLTQSNESLREAKESADEMSRLKTHFLANMSHEIRTPLNGIIGLSEIITDKTRDEEIKKMASMQLESSNRLLNTITSILKLSKMEAEHERIELSKLNINELVKSSVALLRPLADKKKIDLNVESSPAKINCFGTEDIIYQILNNIIGNAIKFTDRGYVKIRSEEKDGDARIIIEDTGIGISKEFLPKIFNAFEQESSGFNRDFEGSGLGLSISSKYIELLGGRLEVISEKGEGTTFTIILPLHY